MNRRDSFVPGNDVSPVRQKSKKVILNTTRTMGTIFCSCGKTLEGLPELHDANGRLVMDAVSRDVHALTQLRIREQAPRGKRARPSKEGQLLKTYQLKSEEYITPVVRTDRIHIPRSRNRWKAGRTTEN